MENTTNVMPGTAPVSQPPIQNPARGDYLNATGQQPTTQNAPANVTQPVVTQQQTLEEILAAVRGNTQQPVTQQPVQPTQPQQPQQPQQQPQGIDPSIDINNMKTGSDALDVAVETFLSITGASNDDINRAVMKAIEYGDAGLIDESFIKTRFGDKADQAMKLAKAVVQHTAEHTNEVVSSVYTMAGSKEQWDAAVEVFKKSASPGLTNAVRDMLNSGRAGTTKEAAELILSFTRNTGALPVNGQRIVPSASTVTAQGLSAAELKAAIHKLNPNSRTYDKDYKTLIQLRNLGKSVGK